MSDMENQNILSGSAASSSNVASRRKRGSRQKMIGKKRKGTKKYPNQRLVVDVSELSSEDMSNLSVSLMSESVVDTSEPGSGGESVAEMGSGSESSVDVEQGSTCLGSQRRKRGKKQQMIGRKPKSSKQIESNDERATDDHKSEAVGGEEVKELEEETQSPLTSRNLSSDAQCQVTGEDFGLWSSMNCLFAESHQTGEIPSDLSLAVEQATEILISQAVGEELCTDVVLTEDLQPVNEDIEECIASVAENLEDEEDLFILPGDKIHDEESKLLKTSGYSVLESLRCNLLLILPDSWIVDVWKDTLRLSYLSPNEVPAVQRAITWHNGVIKIFVHHKPLPLDNFLWNATQLNNALNFGEVCDCLFRLAHLLQTCKVCKGVLGYEEMWSKAEEAGYSYIEKNFQEKDCLRHHECGFILIESLICKSCKKLRTKFKNQRLRKKLKKDATRTNHRYMSQKELFDRAVKVQSEKRKKQKQLDRLRGRIKRLIATDTVNVGHDLSNDLTAIFSQNCSNMTEVQKLFWSEQVKAMSKGKENSRTIRCNSFVIKMALHLQMISPSGYKYVKNFIKLPSERTLYDYTHVVEGKEGPEDFIIGELQKELESKSREEHETYFNLIFDEMTVRSDIVIRKTTGESVGYTNLTSFESEMATVEAQISQTDFKVKPATKVLVYMVQGITTKIRGVVGIYATDALTAAQLYTRTWDIIYSLECRNLKVLTLLCDGASTNKKFFRMHSMLDEQADFVYRTWNLAAPGEDRYIFFMVDPPHLLKSLRNCLANSFSHKKSRKLWKNKEDLSWKVIETLYLETLQDKYKSVKLTRAHMYLTSYSCMKVNLAAQVLSKSVHDAITRLKTEPRFQAYDVDELCQFILRVNNFFDCMNGDSDLFGTRNKENKFLAPCKEQADWRFEYLQGDVLKFFSDWKNDVNKRKGKFKKEERERMFISHESYESLKISVHGFIGAVKYLLSIGAVSIDGRMFNQDKLEQYFGLLRMAGGGKDAPGVLDVIQKSQSLHVQGQAAIPSKRGNTEAGASEWQPDERVIPKRPRRK